MPDQVPGDGRKVQAVPSGWLRPDDLGVHAAVAAGR